MVRGAELVSSRPSSTHRYGGMPFGAHIRIFTAAGGASVALAIATAFDGSLVPPFAVCFAIFLVGWSGLCHFDALARGPA